MAESSVFARLPDDVVLNILFRLEEDLRHWARLACVCTRFSSLVRNVCCRAKCHSTLPSDLLSGGSTPAGGWYSLYKIVFCCPGLRHSGVLREHPDSRLCRESDRSWSLCEDLLNETLYNTLGTLSSAVKRRKTKKRRTTRSRPMMAHVASGPMSLSREKGMKLLANRFREDSLYISDWPGCIHVKKKRNYMLFRGVFMNFKSSKVWMDIDNNNRPSVDLNCEFCSCNRTWNLHSSLCLRSRISYHGDGEPVVRAYVCENGHVSGAWTDLPVYM